MADVLQGNAGNVTTPLSATVSALANNGSGAVRVLTAAPHLFGNNDQIDLETTSTKGTFQITVIDSTHFDCVGSTFTSTGTGTASDLSLTPPIQVPTDGDASSMQLGLLSALQAILDRTQFLAKRGYSDTAIFTASTTWVCPANVYYVTAVGCGGGGGGETPGQIAQNSASTPTYGLSGVGGAGAPLSTYVLPVIPGDTYTIVIGAGGAGGGTTFNPGADGVLSSVQLSGTYLAVFEGGAGGGNGFVQPVANDGSTQAAAIQPGASGPSNSAFGDELRRFPRVGSIFSTANPGGSNAIDAVPHEVGAGGSVGGCFNVTGATGPGTFGPTAGVPGCGGVPLSPGGAAGTNGAVSTSVSTFRAQLGFGGGGGGGGPFGGGGAGGNGSSGNVNATSLPGTAGTAAAANTGAGGGGGGQPGQGSTSGAPGAGGAGGSGLITFYWQTAAAGA